MGTDVYLEWNGKTEEDAEKQRTGFSIDAGGAGYLRASIGMVRENTFLRALFPEKYWDNKAGKPMRYAFTEDKYKILTKAGVVYLMSILAGQEAESSAARKQAEVGDRILKMLKGAGIGEAVKSANLDFRHAIMWINSVWSFFELGMEKESAGLEPGIYISW
jgi:hypothetical protein